MRTATNHTAVSERKGHITLAARRRMARNTPNLVSDFINERREIARRIVSFNMIGPIDDGLDVYMKGNYMSDLASDWRSVGDELRKAMRIMGRR